jgi:hypothetical protein
LGLPSVILRRQQRAESVLVFANQSLNSESVSLWDRSELVSLRQCVSESSSVSLWNQKSTVLAVNYRRRKPVFRRGSEVSEVRSLSLYLVVSCCVSS